MYLRYRSCQWFIQFPHLQQFLPG